MPSDFLLWDADGEAAPLAEAEEFLNAGAAPIVFTPGSAGSTMQRFFKESVKAARQLELRAMLVTNYPEQIPPRLPANIKVFGYLPFSQVLPRAALLVYHGGVGTLAQGIKARSSAPGRAPRLRSIRQRLAYRATGLGKEYSTEPLSRAASGRGDQRYPGGWPISGAPQGIGVAYRRRPRHCARLRFDRGIGPAPKPAARPIKTAWIF